MAIAGKSAVLQINDGGGMVTVATTSIDPGFDYRNEETTEHGNDVQRTLTILDATMTITGNFNDTGSGLTGGQQDLLDAFLAGTQLDVDFYPTGTGGTPKKYNFDAYVTNFSHTAPSTGTQTFTATLALSNGTAPTYST